MSQFSPQEQFRPPTYGQPISSLWRTWLHMISTFVSIECRKQNVPLLSLGVECLQTVPVLQAAVAVKALGTEGEREARAEEIEIATSRWEDFGKFLGSLSWAVDVSSVQRCSPAVTCVTGQGGQLQRKALKSASLDGISDGCSLNEHQNTVEPDLYACSKSMLH